SEVDAAHRSRRPVHLRRPRVQVAAAEEHRNERDHVGHAVSHHLLRDRDDARDAPLPADTVTARVAVVEERDTRKRLIEAAGHLSADHGFKKVTGREIVAAAHANIAAVNYHFGDKLGLYREVVEAAILAQEATTRESREAGEGQPPEERLR